MRCLAGAILAACIVTGCATPATPAVAPAPAASKAQPTPAEVAERQFRERATEAMRRRDYGEALVQWQILLTLQPSSTEYATQLRATRTAIAETSAAALVVGEAARKRGDLDQATVAYLRAVNVDRDNAAATQALREIERERMRRLYLTRPPRGLPETAALMPSTSKAAKRAPPAPAAEVALGDADQGALLYRQGDWAAAAQSLQRAVQKNPQDVVSRGYLADAYYQLALASQGRNQKQDALAYYERAQAAGYSGNDVITKAMGNLRIELGAEYFRMGVDAFAKDPRKAITYWEQSLRYDPANREAAERLKTAKRAVVAG
ncbi:MAG: tetratricopeptide repeat protein [Burkholderiaceae bacterium]